MQRTLSLILVVAGLACGPGGASDGDTQPFDPAVECGLLVDIDTQELRTCARTSNGRVRCWGQIFASDEQKFGDDEPAWNAPWLDLQVDTLSLGADVCGVTSEGLLGCRDPLGAFFDDFESTPFITELVDFTVPAVEVSMGMTGGCVRLADETLRCWGFPDAVGVETEESRIGDDEPPTSVVFGSPPLRISVGHSVACAVLESGEIACWGYGGSCEAAGQTCGTLGVPGVLESATPLLVELPAPAVDVSVGTFNVCARFEDGSFTCWGPPDIAARGGMGGIIGDDETPAAVVPLSFEQPIQQIQVGATGACALLLDGAVQCWGSVAIADPLDWFGDERLDPFVVDPIPLPEPATTISVGWDTACAVGQSGKAYCWGALGEGSLGYGHEHVFGLDPSLTEVQPVPVLDPRCDEP